MRRMIGAGVLALVLAIAMPAAAATPTETLKAYSDHVVKILDDPGLKERKQDRRAAVRKVAEDIFDFGETAKRALGPHWQARTAPEREEFTQLFADLLESTYIARIDEYGGERVKYVAEKIDGDTAVVQTRVVTRKGQEVPVDARMLRRGDKWYIYDVMLEGVSLVNNYRNQFDRIIRSASYAELVKRLRERKAVPAPQPRATR
ncbi:MAG: ABC transporter substrate-binding protein [Candidatus Rokubacteria bacterium]|nr:ABC transporter substrate-binding protein [Candidatus Rokubacteria bacterium]